MNLSRSGPFITFNFLYVQTPESKSSYPSMDHQQVSRSSCIIGLCILCLQHQKFIQCFESCEMYLGFHNSKNKDTACTNVMPEGERWWEELHRSSPPVWYAIRLISRGLGMRDKKRVDRERPVVVEFPSIYLELSHTYSSRGRALCPGCHLRSATLAPPLKLTLRSLPHIPPKSQQNPNINLRTL